MSIIKCRYIEFYDAMSVPMAIAMTGQLFLGQPVMVKPSEVEKNLQLVLVQLLRALMDRLIESCTLVIYTLI